MIALLLVAACSGSNSSGGSSGGTVTPDSVAGKLGCSASAESTEELYVRELGTCSFNGADVKLYTFKDNTARDSWLKVASGFGGTFDVIDRAVITSDTASAVSSAHDKVGGELK